MLLEIVAAQLHNNETTTNTIHDLSPVHIDLNNIFMSGGTDPSNGAQFVIDILRSDAILLSYDLASILRLYQ